MVRTISVHVTIGFYTARVFFGAGETFFPNAVAVRQGTGIPLSKVEHIVITVYSKQIAYIYCTSEELDSIVGTFYNIYIVNGSTVTYTV